VIRDGPSYKRGVFAAALAKVGYKVVAQAAPSPAKDDLILIWNRHAGYWNKLAQRYEKAGAKIIVAENGWIGKGADGNKLYALCRDHHNGPGRWYVGEEDRWSRLGIELKPWRTSGKHVLVLCQRGIGEPGIAQPREWERNIVGRLKKYTDRPIRVRTHPGMHRPPLEPDLENCWACVTWASGAAIKALAAGVPVFHELNDWIGASAARHGIKGIETPFLGDRLPMFRRLAWAQWDLAEIATGEPFRWLLTL
jgi:hypothetical protein